MTGEPIGTGDVAFTVGPVDVFAATRDRPPRPDLPILRNWSHTKSHAVQLGVAFGVFAYFAAAWGFEGSVVGASTYVLVWVFSRRQAASPTSTCEHTVGAHDVVAKPHYFASAVFATVVAAVVAFGFPGTL